MHGYSLIIARLRIKRQKPNTAAGIIYHSCFCKIRKYSTPIIFVVISYLASSSSGFTKNVYNGEGSKEIQVQSNSYGINENETSVQRFGAVCDALSKKVPTDDTAAIQNALNKAKVGNIVTLVPGAQCYVTTLMIPKGVTLKGSTRFPDNPGGSNYAIAVGLLPGLVLERSGSITLEADAGVRDLMIVRADRATRMALPAVDASAFGGDCIRPAEHTGASGTKEELFPNSFAIENVLCIGQARALAPVRGGASRFHIKRFWGDVNPGPGNAAISIIGSNDTTRVSDLHFWPFATSNSDAKSALARGGTGLYLGGQNDDTEIDGAFFINFDIGADFEGTGEVPINRLWVDSSKDNSGTYGIVFGPRTTGVHISQLWSFGSAVSLYSNAGVGNRNSIAQGFLSNPSSCAVLIDSGDLDLGSTIVRMVPPDNPILVIHSSQSYINGYLFDQSTANVGPVVLPPGATTEHYRDLRLTAPNITPGIPTFVGNELNYTKVSSDFTLKLPREDDTFNVVGDKRISVIAGVWGGRRITLTFQGHATIVSSGNVNLSSVDYSGTPGSYISLIYDNQTSRWVEIGRGPSSGSTLEWKSYNPKISSSVGALHTIGFVKGGYQKIRKTVRLSITLNVGNSGDASGALIATLPFPASKESYATLTGSVVLPKQTVLIGIIEPGAEIVKITRYDGKYPAYSGTKLFISGNYETD